MKCMIRRTILSATMAAMLMTCLATPCAAADSKTFKNAKLLESVTLQQYNKSTKSWEATGTYTFTYNEKGDPTTIEWDSYLYRSDYTRTVSYEYRKNGKRKYATYIETGTRWEGSVGSGSWVDYTDKGKITYDKQGRRTKDSGAEAKYKYKKGGLFIGNPKHSCIKKTKIKSWGKGILRKVRVYDDDLSMWLTDSTFNKKGLIKTLFESYNKRTKYHYSYDKKTGLVRTKRAGKLRYLFKYTTKKAGQMRYRTMINSFPGAYEDDLYFFWY